MRTPNAAQSALLHFELEKLQGTGPKHELVKTDPATK